jgi:hypothetical protein
MKNAIRMVMAMLLMSIMVVPSMAATSSVPTSTFNVNLGGNVNIYKYIPAGGNDYTISFADKGLVLTGNQIVKFGTVSYREFTIFARMGGKHTATISYGKPGKMVTNQNIVCNVICRN